MFEEKKNKNKSKKEKKKKNNKRKKERKILHYNLLTNDGSICSIIKTTTKKLINIYKLKAKRVLQEK